MSSPKAKKTVSKKAEPRFELDEAQMTGEDKAAFLRAMAKGIQKPGEEEEAPKVEVLRKISAPVKPQVPSTPESEDALKLAAALEVKFQAGELEALTPEALQALVAALCRYYGATVEAGVDWPILADRMAVSGTDVMVMCGALLKAVDLQVFELGMWQSWSGRR
jgi:hypothetical protein